MKELRGTYGINEPTREEAEILLNANKEATGEWHRANREDILSTHEGRNQIWKESEREATRGILRERMMEKGPIRENEILKSYEKLTEEEFASLTPEQLKLLTGKEYDSLNSSQYRLANTIMHEKVFVPEVNFARNTVAGASTSVFPVAGLFAGPGAFLPFLGAGLAVAGTFALGCEAVKGGHLLYNKAKEYLHDQGWFKPIAE